jgi:metal-responsive CopG/Arc/MetJ family transcriptional regulator
MEMITIKMEKNLLQNIDDNISRFNFSTRTEFIRQAIRDKLDNLKKRELIESFVKAKSSKSVSDKELDQIREKAIRELASEKGWI